MSQYSFLWFPSLLSKGAFKATSRNTLLLSSVLLAASFYSDFRVLPTNASPASLLRGYSALLAYLLLSTRRSVLLQTQQSVNPARHHSLGLLVGAAISIPLGLYGYLTTFATASSEITSTILPLLLLSALTILLLDPFVDKTASNQVNRVTLVKGGFACVAICAWFVGLVAFNHRWKWSDIGLIWLARFCELYFLSGNVCLIRCRLFQALNRLSRNHRPYQDRPRQLLPSRRPNQN